MKIPSMLENFEYVMIGDVAYFPYLDNNTYHNGPGISSSKIRRFSQSQYHALEEVVEQTPAMMFGSAAHSLIVEGEAAFFSDVVTITGSPYTNTNKQLKKDSLAKGLSVITEEQRDTIYSMNNSLVQEAKPYLRPGEDYPQVFKSPKEVSIYWYEQGLLCKARADVVCNAADQPKSKNSIIITYYVTIDNCSIDGFISSAKKNSYYLKAAWNKKGFEKAGFEVDDVIFIAQETVVPYANKVFKMNHADMEIGWNFLSGYLEDYNKMLAGNPATIYNSPNVVELDKL